jgi:spore germination cell wall hydrolase CwlJ-like protein
MVNRYRVMGGSLAVLLALTAAAQPPIVEVVPQDAKVASLAFQSPLAEAKPAEVAAPAPAPQVAVFQPAEWRVAAKSGNRTDSAQSAAADRQSPAKAVARIDERDMECLARAVYYEARGEPLAGQAAVAHVILNRKKSGRFPTSVCGVVDQPGQFTFRTGRPESRHPGQWARARQVAAQVAAGELANPVGGALFFHADHVSPGWRRPRVAEIGNHIFYR